MLVLSAVPGFTTFVILLVSGAILIDLLLYRLQMPWFVVILTIATPFCIVFQSVTWINSILFNIRCVGLLIVPREHMSPHLKSLHWLPIKQRIEFKWFLLIFKAIKLGLPPYFQPYFVPYTSRFATRSTTPENMKLNRDLIPFDRNIHKSAAHYDHCFYTSGPTLWNKLPSTVRCAESLYSFRRQLKGHLFSLAFPP